MSDTTIDLRPRNAVKKIYKPGSPGAMRKELKMTLTQVKRQIKASGGRRELKLLGVIG